MSGGAAFSMASGSRAGSSSESNQGTLRLQGAPRGLLHFYALLSIARKARNGYDLMKEIEFKTEGAWRPGPGAIYPVLQKLSKQGYVTKRKTGNGPTQVLYEITPAGLKNIALAKEMMKSSTERFALMRSLFIDLMDPDDLVRFIIKTFEAQAETLHMIIESEKGGLNDQDKLFVLRQYRLDLERELARAASLINEIESHGRPRVVARRPGQRGRR
jgi:DNA-binding PadR family transcriptional regulator